MTSRSKCAGERASSKVVKVAFTSPGCQGYLYAGVGLEARPGSPSRDVERGSRANSLQEKISYANLDGSGGGDVNVGSATVNLPIGVAAEAARVRP
jgi:hypothetical protein